MYTTIGHLGKKYITDLSKPLDISIPLKAGGNTVNAYYAPPLKIEPVKMGNWIGEVKKGAPVNYRNVFFNPHGNGTHTECVGHISKKNININQCLKKFFFIAELISVKPVISSSDKIISKEQLHLLAGKKHLSGGAVIIRTLPNSPTKLKKNYSGTNPPYMQHEAVEFLVSLGVMHLLIDLPSVDKEVDGGLLIAHKSFWDYRPGMEKISNRTITELIYVPGFIPDGTYLLNLQVAGLLNDAAPSRPVLYPLKK